MYMVFEFIHRCTGGQCRVVVAFQMVGLYRKTLDKTHSSKYKLYLMLALCNIVLVAESI